MQLRHPTQTGTASQSADDLQHAAAMRVQARIDAAERKQASRESAKAFKNFFSIVLMLGVLALGFWAWKSGLLDSALESSRSSSSAISTRRRPRRGPRRRRKRRRARARRSSTG